MTISSLSYRLFMAPWGKGRRQEINLEFWRFMEDNSFHIFSRQLVPISRFDTSYKRVMSKRATSLTQMNTSLRHGRSDACFLRIRQPYSFRGSKNASFWHHLSLGIFETQKYFFFTPKLSKSLPVFMIFGAKIQICNSSAMFQSCLFWSPSMMSPNLSRCYALLLISLVSIFP